LLYISSIVQYVILFRNLHYLQQQLAQVEQQEREQATNAERSMRLTVEKMRIESEQAAPAYASGASIIDIKQLCDLHQNCRHPNGLGGGRR
jgi:hypothetical protein